jgi:hypothetical protein
MATVKQDAAGIVDAAQTPKSELPLTPPTGVQDSRNNDIAAAVEMGTLLCECIKSVWNADSQGAARDAFENLREGVELAMNCEQNVAHFWIAPAPSWDPHAASLLDALCRLGRKLVCRAAAAACCIWSDASFPEKVAETWEGVRQFVAEGFCPRPDLVAARNDLRREAVSVSLTSVKGIPKPLTSQTDDWVLDALAAFEDLPTGCLASLTPAERVAVLLTAMPTTRQPAGTIDWNELFMSPPLSAKQIAAKLRQPLDLVAKKLRDYRTQHAGGYIEDEERGKGGDKYFHKMEEVTPVLIKWLEKRLKKQSKTA